MSIHDDSNGVDEHPELDPQLVERLDGID